jgi:outer membrane protein assembly factor BamB
LVGCSAKNYYDPENIEKHLGYKERLPSPIIESALVGATTQNGEIVIDSMGASKKILSSGFELVGVGDNYIIASSLDGRVVVKTKDGKIIFQHKLQVKALSGSYNEDNHLAMLLSNNETVVIDTKKSKIVFKEKSKKAFTTTADIASPLFIDGLILFPTLDGKIVVVDEKELKFVRDFIIGQQQFFANIIFLASFKDKIITATNEGVYSIGDDNINTLKKEARFLILDEDNLYLLTIDGQVIMLDENLKEKKSRKFSFARFVGVSQSEKDLYIVEHSGYVIKLEKTLEAEKIYGIPDDIDDYIFLDKNIIYYSKKVISIN